MGDRTEDGGRRTEDLADRTEDGGRRAEDLVEGENVADLRGRPGVAEEASNGQIKNLTSEPNGGFCAPETAVNKKIAALCDVANDGMKVLSKMRDLGIGTSVTPVGGGGKGLEAIAASISGRGPLLRPIS